MPTFPNSHNPLILVTGATGKTGQYVVEQLLEQGYPVRAMARQRDERSAHLEQLGAEVVLGDFLDQESIRHAVTGTQRVYFCYPPQGDSLVEATAIMAIAARDAGIEALVNMSQITARDGARSSLTRNHWQSEQIFDWADIGAIHIRPTYFAEMLIILGAQTIATQGKLYLPYGAEKHAPVTAEDIGRVVTYLLIDPALHVGERLILTGPDNMTIAEMADVLATELGHPVDHVDLPLEQWEEILGTAVGLPEYLVSHLVAVAQDHQDGIFNAQTDTVERITGQPPQSLAAFIRENREAFAAPEPARQAG